MRQKFTLGMAYRRRLAPIVLASLAMTACISEDLQCRRDIVDVNYLSYEDLRSAIAWLPPEPVLVNGKIILYNDLLLVNDPGRGIHVFDNTVPEQPSNLGFINVPGNNDLVIYNDELYADSYVDLVKIDLSDLNNVHESGRTENVFSYQSQITAYSSIPYTVDETQGIALDIQRRTINVCDTVEDTL